MRFKLLFLVAFLISISLISQNKKQKWTAGVSIAAAKYSFNDAKIVGGQLAHQIPRINISRYFLKNFTLDAAFSTAIGDKQDYTTFDGAIRYDFGTSRDEVVPYILVGGSFINAVRFTPTLNFGAGATFWFNGNYGLNFQLLYKFSETQFESQRSHLYPSVGLVYSFSYRSLRRTFWDD